MGTSMVLGRVLGTSYIPPVKPILLVCGSPFLVSAPFVGGGFSLGITSSGQVFVQFQASGMLGAVGNNGDVYAIKLYKVWKQWGRLCY
jgi:hypothetical protein